MRKSIRKSTGEIMGKYGTQTIHKATREHTCTDSREKERSCLSQVVQNLEMSC